MRITRLWPRWLALASLPMLVAARPPAEVSAPPPNPEIVVQGQQERALRAFVEAMANPGRSQQLGRWDREICPAVLGVDQAQADYIAARIAQHAAPLGLRAHSGGCTTTMLIVVSNEAQALASSFARGYPVTLGSDGRARLRRFAASRAPVRWISVTELCPFGCALPNSRLSLATHPAFRAMILIVDGRQIGAFGLGELADYVPLVVLGNPPLTGARPETSILSMFDRARPEGYRFELTGNDRSFLAGLYRSRVNAPASEQRASIARRMRRNPEN
jgi:hypothetical protein